MIDSIAVSAEPIGDQYRRADAEKGINSAGGCTLNPEAQPHSALIGTETLSLVAAEPHPPPGSRR